MNLLTGLFSTLTWHLIKDTLHAILRRIAWPIVLERLLTRLIIHSLRSLARLSSNTLVDDTVEHIAAQLEQHQLPKATEHQPPKP